MPGKRRTIKEAKELVDCYMKKGPIVAAEEYGLTVGSLKSAVKYYRKKLGITERKITVTAPLTQEEIDQRVAYYAKYGAKKTAKKYGYKNPARATYAIYSLTHSVKNTRPLKKRVFTAQEKIAFLEYYQKNGPDATIIEYSIRSEASLRARASKYRRDLNMGIHNDRRQPKYSPEVKREIITYYEKNGAAKTMEKYNFKSIRSLQYTIWGFRKDLNIKVKGVTIEDKKKYLHFYEINGIELTAKKYGIAYSTASCRASKYKADLGINRKGDLASQA